LSLVVKALFAQKVVEVGTEVGVAGLAGRFRTHVALLSFFSLYVATTQRS
jgi:hypothetical protein